ncbi:DegT/DnrJ/EryC1/StrS family aminotransferase [Hyphococcus flavus]|uniref:DegT/DnrJ/EryC1/StrS family aminotransferase n=1 Tax=Hyphococcus flavus TaxID=1866326 RepID=A0AAF0CE25_9PROT|nr:DegT/DnrJ/EryC1/StrS family aminotransferase [Hyphococcus flavus]WDI30551.1 DegT/DnrJ/EryC1/StrS family aminotransferase [Hyphococcus flavus]
MKEISARRNTFLPLTSPQIGEEEIEEVVRCLRSGWLATGPRSSEFESAICDLLGSEYAVALSSCTAALHLSMLALGIGESGNREDEVITTPISWPATSNMIWHSGARPIFADIDPDTLNLDIEQVEQKISKRTKAIIPVHMAGQPCDMDELIQISLKHGIPIIEDSAHALGADYKGEMIGGKGRNCCFSFHATKNITCGEGGMFTTSDSRYADRVRILSQHGVVNDSWRRYCTGELHWRLVEPGLKYGMPDILASIGIHQLRRLPHCIEVRRKLAAVYDHKLKGIKGVEPLIQRDDRKSAYNLYIVRMDCDALGITRDEMILALRKNNIGSGVHFQSTHLQPFYQGTLGMSPDSLPIARKLSEQIISLPLSSSMTQDDVDDVIYALTQIISENMSSGADVRR